MLSCPPATTQWASPALMAWAPSITALRPEPQTLLMVTAPTLGSIPALIWAWRAGARPWPPVHQGPHTNFSPLPATHAGPFHRRLDGDGAEVRGLEWSEPAEELA